MRRNILKMPLVLICSMALLLAAAPIRPLCAAENMAESAIDTDAQAANASEPRETYYVNAQNGLRMRSAPSKDSDVITILPYGAKVSVIGTAQTGWYEIEYSGDTGYVAAKYVTKSDETDSDSDTNANDSEEGIPSTESSLAGIQATLGITPVIGALIAAIIIMILLAIYTAFSFLRKDKERYDDDYDNNDDGNYDDDYDDYDNENENDDENNHDNEYVRDEYYDDEYYDDEE